MSDNCEKRCDMRKKGIFNQSLQTAISNMGHTDILIISDAGLPVARPEQRVDLAVAEDLPTVAQVLRLVMEELICEKVIVAEEQRMYNPLHYQMVREIAGSCPLETVPHEKIFDYYVSRAKYIVRTGSLEPWGNVILTGGIDAKKWFSKEGCIAPDYYKDRASREV